MVMNGSEAPSTRDHGRYSQRGRETRFFCVRYCLTAEFPRPAILGSIPVEGRIVR